MISRVKGAGDNIPDYRRDIDGLRALAILSVLIFHAFPSILPGGFVGVDVFFVISGFLISGLIFKGLEINQFSIAVFYARRIKRIFPALIVILLATYAMGWFTLLADEFKALGKYVFAGVGFLENVVLYKEAGYFDTASELKPLMHLWSLAVEEQFYLIFPLLVWCITKVRLNLFLILSFAILAGFALNIHETHINIVGAFFLPQPRFWELLCGALLAYFRLRLGSPLIGRERKYAPRFASVKRIQQMLPGASLLCNTASVGGLLGLVLSVFIIHQEYRFPGWWVALPVVATLLILVAGPKAWCNRYFLSNPAMVWIGLISYPLYLWHWPLLSYARIISSAPLSVETRILILIASTILAWATYIFIEKPIRLGRRMPHRVLILGVLAVLIGVTGFNTYQRDGYAFRTYIKQYKNNRNELVRTPAIDAGCLKYVGNQQPLFDYCRFNHATDNDKTVALIGDSHAHVAFAGVADLLTESGVNTLMLANSSCPPFLGYLTGREELAREGCRKKMDQLIDAVANNRAIRKVFIFSRGPIYIYGRGFGAIESPSGVKTIYAADDMGREGAAAFGAGLDKTIARLKSSGKTVYYVLENPEMGFDVSVCVARPFRDAQANCSIGTREVLKRQSEYRSAVSAIPGIKVIDTLSAFCKGDSCSPVRNGVLLYADNNHLSVSGSQLQADEILKPYLLAPD